MARHEIVASFWDEPVGPPVGYVRHRRGAVIDVPDEHAERLLRVGAIVPVEADSVDDQTTGDASLSDDSAVAAPVTADGTATPAGSSIAPQEPAAAPAVGERPKQAAAKSVWVEYAVSRGMDRDEAEALDKRELIAALN
ncbi:hypothetical protein I0Q12_19390 [Rhodococcus sp. CX]|uniref:hypothetical protein n=1 Tax=Rhodococcus sp. CX TaxID=2789880 RepID=UPI0018CF1296|nr:hypothetical protein [Rhodococcus sp. CX]MBH0121555.1 hypothetical protein [Rhodococcus sp. CX]